MFPGRIPEDANVKFQLHDDKDGLTEWSLLNPKGGKITVSIPREAWNNRGVDNAPLIDVINHELVHVADIASGRAYQYYIKYGGSPIQRIEKAESIMKNIMDYKAYSENRWYNNYFRPDRPDIFSKQVGDYRKLLPKGWWEIQ